MEREIKIEVASIHSNINQYLPVLKEYDYKEEPSTIYLTHLHELFDLVEKLRKSNPKAGFDVSLIVGTNSILIYDDWIE